MTAPRKRTRSILFLSRWFPFPADNGSKLRIRGLLSGMADYYDISLISFADRPTGARDIATAQALCRDVHIVSLKAYDPTSLKARWGYLSPTPRSLKDTFSIEMARRIQAVVSARRPDLIIASEVDTAIYHRNFSRVPALFDEAEVGSLHQKYAHATTGASAVRNGLTWWKHSRFLADLLRHYQACTVVSEAEQELIRRIAPRNHRVEIIPNCVCMADYVNICEIPEPNSLIFTGSLSYRPNLEAARWFVQDVYPRVKARMPALGLTITGEHSEEPLPHEAGVVYTGLVADVRPLIARSWISIVPILSGGGTRLKILEAMALHTPVVSTRKGAEGLAVKHDTDILIADTPEEFVRQILRLLHEPGLRQRLVARAYQLIQSRYSWSVVMPRFISLAEAVIDSTTAGDAARPDLQPQVRQ